MGMSCCTHRYDTDYNNILGIKDLISLYDRDLQKIKFLIKDIEASQDEKNNKELRYLKIFFLKGEEIKQRLSKKSLKDKELDLDTLKILSTRLFSTLDDKSEDNLKTIYYGIINHIKQYSSYYIIYTITNYIYTIIKHL